MAARTNKQKAKRSTNVSCVERRKAASGLKGLSAFCPVVSACGLELSCPRSFGALVATLPLVRATWSLFERLRLNVEQMVVAPGISSSPFALPHGHLSHETAENRSVTLGSMH